MATTASRPAAVRPKEIAAISMSGSSVLVAVNALALKRLHLPSA
jgi:cation transport ATPase